MGDLVVVFVEGMFLRVSIFVFLSWGFFTFRYSHDLHAKKKAAMVSCAVAF